MRGYQDDRVIEIHRRPRAVIEVVSSKVYRNRLGEEIVRLLFFQTTRLIAASVEMTRHNIGKALIAMFLIRLPRIKSFLIRRVKFIALIVSANKIVIIVKIDSKILWSLVSGVNFR